MYLQVNVRNCSFDGYMYPGKPHRQYIQNYELPEHFADDKITATIIPIDTLIFIFWNKNMIFYAKLSTYY